MDIDTRYKNMPGNGKPTCLALLERFLVIRNTCFTTVSAIFRSKTTLLIRTLRKFEVKFISISKVIQCTSMYCTYNKKLLLLLGDTVGAMMRA